ncbi:hypothetical protein POTOM_053674 [Populus tomentosa]|uniref:Uncharacterized protein n=2 Tax=Populus TaxID=3689 RepID=A0A8X7Y3C6_POPTO|nr:hypothetical protein POTOM_053674 [Populus tomentosa]
MSADWGPVVVAVVLFIVLSPGLLFQLPARTRVVEFGNMYTSGISILVHAVIYFCIITILIIAIGEAMAIRMKVKSSLSLSLYQAFSLTLGVWELEGNIVVVGYKRTSKEGRLRDFLTLRMNDWAASLIAAALFAFLSPGLVFQMPGKERPLDFMNMKTSLAAIFVHMVIYGLLLVLLLVILHVHLYV